MDTYTFIASYKGGIYIHQVSARNVLQACHVWASAVINEKDIEDLNSVPFLKNFNEDLNDLPPVPLQNTPNVWSFTVGSGKNFMIINIIKTEMKTIETQLPALTDAATV